MSSTPLQYAHVSEESRRCPAEEKRRDFEHQRRGFSEYTHSLRHGKWRKKRRAALKPERQGAVQALTTLLKTANGGTDALDVDLLIPRRRPLKKWGAMALDEWIARGLARRRRDD